MHLKRESLAMDRDTLRRMFPHSFEDIEAAEFYEKARQRVIKDFYCKGRLVMFQAPWQGRTWVSRMLERFLTNQTPDEAETTNG